MVKFPIYSYYLISLYSCRNTNFFGLGLKSVVCIPTAIQTLEDHEGRHSCAYDHPKGFRAVGVGYNLDDDVESRRAELSRLFLDYDKVYSGDSCLWDIQITTLATLDAQRALKQAAEAVEPLDDFCCEVQAVFVDIQLSIGASKSLSGRDLKDVVEKASVGDWSSAAHELKKTNWCYDNKLRCDDNFDVVKSGCDKLSG
jgi:GH24 family phage-related lysozyme (muramidase)